MPLSIVLAASSAAKSDLVFRGDTRLQNTKMVNVTMSGGAKVAHDLEVSGTFNVELSAVDLELYFDFSLCC